MNPLKRQDSLRRIDSVKSIQSSAMEILSRQESTRRLQPPPPQSSPGVRDSVINELLNWKDDNIQRLLSNLDAGSGSRLDDYEDIREKMDRLWGAASRYKGLSHTEMEEVLEAFSAEALTPQMLEQISGDEDLKQAFQRVAVTKIPQQMEKLFLSLSSLLQSMRQGSPPSAEEEERLLREAQSVMLTCSSFQSVSQPSPSNTLLKLQQALRPSDKAVSEEKTPRSARVAESDGPRPDKPKTRFFRASDGRIAVDSERHSIERVESLKKAENSDSSAVGGSVPSHVMSPVGRQSSMERRDRAPEDHSSVRSLRAPTLTVGTQTDPPPPEPIAELTGQKMRVFDIGEVRRQARSR